MDVATFEWYSIGLLILCQLLSGLAIVRFYSVVRQLRASIPPDHTNQIEKLTGDVKAAQEQSQRAVRSLANVAGTFRTLAHQMEQVRM